MTTSEVVVGVVRIWLIGYKFPFSAILALVSVYIWVVPWYLHDPKCDITIKRETRWGNILSLCLNAFLGYVLWPITPLAILWMVAQALTYHLRYKIDFTTAFQAVWNDHESTLLATQVTQGGEFP